MKTERPSKEYFNKKARFDYKIEDSFEVGIVLTGDEIKAIRNGRVNITGSYAKIMSGELFWIGANFEVAKDKQRTKKLLVHREQLNKLIGKVSEQGYSLLPLKLYFKKGRAKLELGVGKGMKKYDKRELLKKKDIDRETARAKN